MTTPKCERCYTRERMTGEQFCRACRDELDRQRRELKRDSADSIEAELQRELMRCPECEQLVYTKPAEGVPAQLLRGCNNCGAVFMMDHEEVPL